jgi:hypothetical protein
LTAAAGIAASSNAAVVAWENCNLVIPNNIDGLYINVESRVTGNTGGSVPGWDINPYSATGLTFFNPSGGGIARLAGATSPSNLPLGTEVGASSTFGGGSALTTGIGAWQLNAVNYFGFRFVASTGLTHYGYASFSIGSALNGTDRTITNIYFEDVAGASIVVPAPGAIALLGLAGLAGRRRR